MKQEEWKIGDVAICIDNKGSGDANNPPLRLHKEYVVEATYKCTRCKGIMLDVGFDMPSNGRLHCACGNITTGNTIHWCNSSRFIKKKSMEDSIEEQYNEILKPKELVKQL